MRKLSVFLLAATANALLCTPGVRHRPRTANFSPVMHLSESESDAAALSAQRELSTALSKARRNSESLPDLPGGAAAVAYSPAIVAYTLWLTNLAASASKSDVVTVNPRASAVKEGSPVPAAISNKRLPAGGNGN